ncbi:AI-2E family transporter [Verrucomicrobiales bacterium]|nr:AI-2E family transporter [Verrucomicrobiales bacterium]MDB4808503.1 AI-2E family transporter [Verrucomicrobiales bacterium]
MARKGKPRPESYPTLVQRRWCWDALTLASLVTIGTIIVGLIWLTTRILGFLQPLLVPIAAAGIIAYLLDPLVTKLKNLGISSFRSVLIVFSGFMLFMIILALSVFPAAFSQAADLYENDRHKIIKGVQDYVVGLRSEDSLLNNKYVRPIVETIEKGVQDPNSWDWLKEKFPDLAAKAWSFVGKSLGFLGYVIGFFLVPVYLFFFLKEGQVIKRNWTNYVPLRASKAKDEVVGVLQEINGYLIAFFRGQLLVSMIDGVLVALCLLVIGMPYAILIGVFVALLGIIPYIGNLMCLIPALAISLWHFSNNANQIFGINQVWIYPLIVIGIFTVTQQMNSLVTAPKIVGDSVGLHPLTVIFSVLFWSLLIGGFLGSLLAVPLTASIKVLFRRYIWEMKFQHEAEPTENEAAPA